MSRTPLLLLGMVVCFLSAWLGVVYYSQVTLGRLAPVTDATTGQSTPPQLLGLAQLGERVYAANGCVSCHTQQVRPASLSRDIEGKLGPRRTVARDYLGRDPVFLGLSRIGPDLTNYGLRVTSPNDVHRQLFDPEGLIPGSIMPAYRSLYKVRKISGHRAWNAVKGLSGSHAPAEGWEVVPSPEAEALVAYLLSLQHNVALPEAPLPKP